MVLLIPNVFIDGLPIHGGRTKFCHINGGLLPVVLPWQVMLHKLSMVVDTKCATSFRHNDYLTTLVVPDFENLIRD